MIFEYIVDFVISNIYPFFYLSNVLFLVGVFSLMFNRNNILVIVMAIELILLPINMFFIFFSIYLEDVLPKFLVLFMLSAAATEFVIGLAIVVIYYRVKGTFKIKK